MNTLAGFDLVYAITQGVLNRQMELLWAQSILPQRWRYPLDPNQKSATSIDAELGSPYVDLDNGDASTGKVRVSFPLTGGRASYGVIDVDAQGNLVASSREVDVAGWRLVLVVNLSLSELAESKFKNGPIPEEIKAQLSAFTDEMYSIQHLFMNFQDAHLLSSYKLEAGDNGDMLRPEVIQGMNSMVKSLVEQCTGGQAGTPFILGYQVNDKPGAAAQPPAPQPKPSPQQPKPAPSPQPAPASDFSPTGTTYSVSLEKGPEDAERSTLNYLSVTGGKALPGADAGRLNRRWVVERNIQGVFVISEPLVINPILPSIAAAFGLKPADFKWEKHRLVARVPNKSGSVDVCTLEPYVKTPQLGISYIQFVDKKVRDKLGSKIGEIEGGISSLTVLTFGFDEANDLKIDIKPGEAHEDLKLKPNALGKFESLLASAADEIIGAFKDDLDDYFKTMAKSSWKLELKRDLSTSVTKIRTRLILPAHGQFFFKDAEFLEEGHLALAVTIKN